MSVRIPKSVLLDFIENYDENEPPEPESSPEHPIEEPIPEEPVIEEPKSVINCYENSVSYNPDYMICKSDFHDLLGIENSKSKLIPLTEQGTCTGNYITLDAYESILKRWENYVKENGHEPDFINVYIA